MNMAHDHNHDHIYERAQVITLVDEQETEEPCLKFSFPTIDSMEEFGKKLCPSCAPALMLKR